MFGIDIIDAGLLPGMLVAFLAGILSFLSPCVLPVVPPYLAYMSGISATELTDKSASKSAVLPALFFVLGLSTVFLLLGFTASAFGLLFLSYQSSFNTLAGLLVMLFGLHFLSVIRIGFLDREARFDVGDRGGSSFGAYILGLAFALAGRPVSGHNWARYYLWQPARRRLPAAPFYWQFTPWAWGCHFCLLPLFCQN